MKKFFRLNPITRKRLQRFRRIKRGFYSLIILLVAVFLSLFSEYIANNRAIMVYYEGKLYFPTWKFIPMSTFGQEDDWGDDGMETEYARLKEEFKGTKNWVLMPPIPWNPTIADLEHYDFPPPHPPDKRHFLGTDSGGNDVLARLIYGFRISIFFALGMVLASQLIGVTIGSLQGYLAGRFDLYSQRAIEIWSTVPFLYVVIILGSIFARGFWMLLIMMTVFSWMSITYFMRTEMYREKTREYCLAARSFGAGHLRIIFRHLLPNCITPLVTFTPFLIVGAISSLTALDYLGYGMPPPTPSWGEMFDQALKPENRGKTWLVLSPFVAVVSTLTLVTFIGESVREAFDPKQYARYE